MRQVDFCRILPVDYDCTFSSLYSKENLKLIQQAAETCDQTGLRKRFKHKPVQRQQSNLNNLEQRHIAAQNPLRTIVEKLVDSQGPKPTEKHRDDDNATQPIAKFSFADGRVTFDANVVDLISKTELRSTSCGQMFTLQPGDFLIPAKEYNHFDCNWNIQPVGSDVVTLTIKDFEVGYSSYGCYDAYRKIVDCPKGSYYCQPTSDSTICGSISDTQTSFTSSNGGFAISAHISAYYYPYYANACITWGDGTCPIDVPNPLLESTICQTVNDYIVFVVHSSGALLLHALHPHHQFMSHT